MRTKIILLLAVVGFLTSSAHAQEAEPSNTTTSITLEPQRRFEVEPKQRLKLALRRLAQTNSTAKGQPERVKATAPQRSKWLDRFSIALPVQVNLIGLSGGLQPELLFRPISADSGLHLRVAVGFFGGQEFFHLVPLALGFRWIWLRNMRFQPFLGFGFVWHTFLPYDTYAHNRIDLAIELGFRIAITKGFSIGINISPEFALASFSSAGFYGMFGLGLATRLTLTKDLPW